MAGGGPGGQDSILRVDPAFEEDFRQSALAVKEISPRLPGSMYMSPHHAGWPKEGDDENGKTPQIFVPDF